MAGSRRLVGLDPENDQAEPRGIVIHSAPYVCADFVAQFGRVGRSEGCFAVSSSEISSVLDLLGPGRLLYARADCVNPGLCKSVILAIRTDVKERKV